MSGKHKCKILKEIRQRIADENDIPYITRECHFQGECRGTCPRCESELRYLEQQLAIRASMGKRIAVAALCAGMTLTTVSCAKAEAKDDTEILGGQEIMVTEGEVAYPEEESKEKPEDNSQNHETTIEVEGKYPGPVEMELSGDIAYPLENYLQ